MGRRRRMENWILYAAAVLLCLTLLTTCMTGRLYARYSTGTTVSDGARVAAFQITEAGDLTQTFAIDQMKPGDTEVFTVDVTSNSEVAVYYTISVENVYGNLPLTFKMLDQRGTIAPNDNETKTYQLQVNWPSDKNTLDYVGKTDLLKVTLRAEQVD